MTFVGYGNKSSTASRFFVCHYCCIDGDIDGIYIFFSDLWVNVGNACGDSFVVRGGAT